MTIIKIAMAIARNTNFLLLKNEEDLFLNKEDPHLEQTILPPKERSETNEELPQLKQTLFTLILIKFLANIFKLYFKKQCKEKLQYKYDNENLLQ